MRITNNRAYDIFLEYIGSMGKLLPASSYLDTDDAYASNESLQALVTRGDVTISDYSVSDVGLTTVSPAEAHTYFKGLYVIPSWSAAGVITAGTPYSIAGTLEEPYNLAELYKLILRFDSLYTVTVDFSAVRGEVLLSTILSTINTAISGRGIAADDGSGHILITSVSVGTDSKVEVVDDVLSCHLILGFETPTVTPSTGRVATVTFNTLNPTGVGILDIPHNIKLYTTNVGMVLNTEFQIQRASNGVMATSNTTINTGTGGATTFEVGATPLVITEPGCWVDVDIPSTHPWAMKPATRLQVY